MDCIFCKIAEGKIPTELVYEDDFCVAFNDINKQAPHHILVIPKQHIKDLNQPADGGIFAAIFKAIPQIAKDKGFSEAGYRVCVNCGEDGGQTVSHLHFHVLAGRSLGWPPG